MEPQVRVGLAEAPTQSLPAYFGDRVVPAVACRALGACAPCHGSLSAHSGWAQPSPFLSHPTPSLCLFGGDPALCLSPRLYSGPGSVKTEPSILPNCVESRTPAYSGFLGHKSSRQGRQFRFTPGHTLWSLNCGTWGLGQDQPRVFPPESPKVWQLD